MLHYTFEYAAEFWEDVDEIMLYHEQVAEGLSTKFAIDLEKATQVIERNPKSGSTHYNNVRCIPLKKFDYMVHYEIDEAHLLVRITSVYATRRKPKNED